VKDLGDLHDTIAFAPNPNPTNSSKKWNGNREEQSFWNAQ